MENERAEAFKIKLIIRLIIVINTTKLFLVEKGGMYTFPEETRELFNVKENIGKAINSLFESHFKKILQSIVQVENRFEKLRNIQSFLIHVKKEPPQYKGGRSFELTKIPDGKHRFDPDVVRFINSYRAKVKSG